MQAAGVVISAPLAAHSSSTRRVWGLRAEGTMRRARQPSGILMRQPWASKAVSLMGGRHDPFSKQRGAAMVESKCRAAGGPGMTVILRFPLTGPSDRVPSKDTRQSKSRPDPNRSAAGWEGTTAAWMTPASSLVFCTSCTSKDNPVECRGWKDTACFVSTGSCAGLLRTSFPRTGMSMICLRVQPTLPTSSFFTLPATTVILCSTGRGRRKGCLSL
mmetsp:Transcript_30632/g.79778  ORF Transcript_30632/g.79778 Transcript_30632/m.79778 type:complete len:216 (+) Transcript_30632:2232-2879(+)